MVIGDINLILSLSLFSATGATSGYIMEGLWEKGFTPYRYEVDGMDERAWTDIIRVSLEQPSAVVAVVNAAQAAQLLEEVKKCHLILLLSTLTHHIQSCLISLRKYILKEIFHKHQE